jgi:TPR repeat protein
MACDEDASALFGLWDYNKRDCYKMTTDAAEKNDVLAMGNLSALFREGIGVDKDPLRAVTWAHKATELKPPSARAQNDMGYYYETGSSVTKDLKEAEKFYTMASKRYPLAKTNLDRLKKKAKDAPSLATNIDY